MIHCWWVLGEEHCFVPSKFLFRKPFSEVATILKKLYKLCLLAWPCCSSVLSQQNTASQWEKISTKQKGRITPQLSLCFLVNWLANENRKTQPLTNQATKHRSLYMEGNPQVCRKSITLQINGEQKSFLKQPGEDSIFSKTPRMFRIGGIRWKTGVHKPQSLENPGERLCNWTQGGSIGSGVGMNTCTSF